MLWITRLVLFVYFYAYKNLAHNHNVLFYGCIRLTPLTLVYEAKFIMKKKFSWIFFQRFDSDFQPIS